MSSTAKLPRAVPPEVSARDAGLRYVSDGIPGIRRVRANDSFSYVAPDGSTVEDEAALKRIRALVIPPNWTDVWISPKANGHVQATGRDAKGRKQYRYHTLYRQAREETKFEKMILFGELLPKIRERLSHDLARHGLPKEKVLAAVVRLMDLAHLRIGNEEYARQNESYGLTTMRNKHVRVNGNTVRFRFKGKSGKVHDLEIDDRRVARVIARCRDLPGYELFQYVDENAEAVSIDSAMVNQYLRDTTGEDVTAKDFRTWHGTVHAALELGACGAAATEAESKRNIVAAIKTVAERLGNRPATCRKYYVHPLMLEAYAVGPLPPELAVGKKAADSVAFSAAERCVLELLRNGARTAPQHRRQ